MANRWKNLSARQILAVKHLLSIELTTQLLCDQQLKTEAEILRDVNIKKCKKNNNDNSRGLVVGELQLSLGVLVVLPSLGGAWLSVVRQDDGAAGARVAHHRHLHGAHTLAHPHHALAEREDAGVVVIQDGHRSDQGLNQSTFGGGTHFVALEHPLCVADTQIQEAHKEVLVLLEYVVVDDTDLESTNRRYLYLSFSILCHFILYILEENVVLVTPLHLFDS